MTGLCGVKVDGAEEVHLAIDAPLGWPEAMVELVTRGQIRTVPSKDGQNPYTRRATELDLVRQGHSPLSTVRDMIGSQSTKAIYFLNRAGLQAQTDATWSRQSPGYVTAFETYPAVALKSTACAAVHGPLMSALLSSHAIRPKAHDDLRDALACAVVAFLAATRPDQIQWPPADYPAPEGWIILPR